jgi:hypothetical protein
MQTLPIELLALIVTADEETFLAALRAPFIGQLCCHEYIQNYAKRRFSTIVFYPTVTIHKLFSRAHRDDLPAIEHHNGNKYWCRYGKIHRVGDMHAAELYGSKYWYWNDMLHRENGPAVECPNGDKYWYWYDKRHRYDNLPAIEYHNGDKEYWINGVRQI